MARGKKSGTRKRHNARKLILSVFAAAPAPKKLRTSEIFSKVSALGGKIPAYSVYQALRTLVKNKKLSSSRHGRELTFSAIGGPSAAARSREAPAAVESMSKPETPVEAVTDSTEFTLPHRLAPGEVSILHIGEEHVEAATNLHGKLVIEKHRRPSA